MKLKYYISQLTIFLVLIIGYIPILILSFMTFSDLIDKFTQYLWFKQQKTMSAYIFSSKLKNVLNRKKSGKELKTTREVLKNKEYNLN